MFLSGHSVAAKAQRDAARIEIVTLVPASFAEAVDVGAVPSSQRLTITLTLAPSAARTAELDQYLSDLTDAGSHNYHKWLTPEQFGARFGPELAQRNSALLWAQAQNLTVEGVSPSGDRLVVSGFASQMEAAFAVTLRNFQVHGGSYFASAAQPSVPETAGARIFVSVAGLDNLPDSSAVNDAFSSLAKAVDENKAAISLLATPHLSSAIELSPSQLAAYGALLRQGAAQGITFLAPLGLLAQFTEVAALVTPGGAANASISQALRPSWQNAPGLPDDLIRHTPDLAAESEAALTRAVSTMIAEGGSRLGNIAPVLYALAPVPGLFTQPDSGDAGYRAGSWEPRTGLGLVDLHKLASVFPRGSGGSSTTVSASASSPMHGQPFTLSAAVASSNGGSVPTGTVTFSSAQAGFLSSTVGLTASGQAISTPYLLPGGAYTITATYSGDATYAPSSSTTSVTVQPEAAGFTLTSPGSSPLGSTISVLVTLKAPSGFGTPAASVTVTPSGISGLTAITKTLTGSAGTASATFTFAASQAGSLSFQASCTPSDSSFTCFTPQTSSTTVPQVPATTTLTISPTNPNAGTKVSFTAVVAGVSGIPPSGSVQFFDGSTNLGSGGAPNATFSSTLLPGTTHVLSAVYQGDNNYLKTNSNTVNASVGTASTTTTVSASAMMAGYGQNITLNITVSPSALVNGTLPTGTLTFTGAGTTTSAAVSGGAANVTLSLPVGTYTIGTSYSGDTNYSASTGNVVMVTVTQAAATLNASISSPSFTTGSSSTLTVTVSLPGSAQLPTGSTFVAALSGAAGTTYTGTFLVNTGGNTGTGSIVIPAPPAGTYTLQITCTANSNYACTPSTLPLTSTATTVTPPGAAATSTTLAVSPTMPLPGQPVTLTATIATTGPVAGTPLAGTVSFYDGTVLLASAPISVVSGAATATGTAALTGSSPHSLTAVYAGNSTYATSTSAPVTVAAASTAAAVTLTSNTASGLAGVNVVLTATVSGTSASGRPASGNVSFFLVGGTPSLIGTAPLAGAGSAVSIAVLSSTTIPAGSQTIYAVYSGDTSFSSVTSNNIMLGLTDYNVTFVPQSLTLARGKSGQSTLILGIVGGFNGTVTFGCTPAPNTQVTCSLSPTVLTGGGSTTLTITTTAPRTQLAGVRREHHGLSPNMGVTGGASLAALLCLLLPDRRRRRVPALFLALLALGSMANLGCATGNFGSIDPIGSNNAGSPLGTTTVVVNTAGSDGVNTVRHNFSFQVTIQ